MTTPHFQADIDLVTAQCVARRIEPTKWLAFVHQLRKRHHITASLPEPAAVSIISRLLSASVIDPLLVEYLKHLIYGAATPTGTSSDQGPICDALNVTMQFLASVWHSKGHDHQMDKVLASLEAISSVVGQGLIVAFDPSGSFNAQVPSFLSLLQGSFSRILDQETATTLQDNDTGLASCVFAFLQACLLLLQLASTTQVALAQNLLTPRVAISMLINCGQSLLACLQNNLSLVIHNLPSPKSKQEPTFPTSSAQATVTLIETILQTMNPSWESEIALLRNLAHQTNLLIELDSRTSSQTTSSLPTSDGGKATGNLQGTLKRPVWDHFVNVASIAASRSPEGFPKTVEPEVVLLLRYLVDERASWKSKMDSVRSLFLARRADAAPAVTLDQSLIAFYFDLLVAAVDACAVVIETPPAFKAGESYAPVWRNALCGLLPEVIVQLEQWLDSNPHLPLRGLRQNAPHVRCETVLKALLVVSADRLGICESQHAQSIGQNSSVINMVPGSNGVSDSLVGVETPPHQPIRAWLLRSFIEHLLTRPEAITDEFPNGHKLAEEVQALSQSLRMDAQMEGLNLANFFEQKLTSEDPAELLQKLGHDPGIHFAFAQQLLHQIQFWFESHDLESISRCCKALLEDIQSLDTVTMYMDPLELTMVLASLLDKPDMYQESDDSSTVCNVLLFVQLLCHRYSILPNQIVSLESRSPFLARYLQASSIVYRLSDLRPDESAMIGRWISALFDNEGISDDLIRDSSPMLLMTLAPTLFSQSINACISGMIDVDTLRGGLSYFLQDLLSYALPGALRWLMREVLRIPLVPITTLDANANGLNHASKATATDQDGVLPNGLSKNANSRTVHLEIFSLLLNSDACPAVVRQLVSKEFDRFITSSRLMQSIAGCETFDLESMVAKMEGCSVTMSTLSSTATWVRAMVPNTVGIESSPMLDSSLEKSVTRLGSDVLAKSLFQQLSSQSESCKTEKAIAAWLVLSCMSASNTNPDQMLLVLMHMDLAEATDERSVVAISGTWMLTLSLLESLCAVRGQIENQPETVTRVYDKTKNMLALKLARLQAVKPSLACKYLEVFQNSEESVKPSSVLETLHLALGIGKGAVDLDKKEDVPQPSEEDAMEADVLFDG